MVCIKLITDFLEKLAGDERAVLVRNKAPYEGDIWTEQFNISLMGKFILVQKKSL